jgi:4'-phosphopantetheinyl transferase EntD
VNVHLPQSRFGIKLGDAKMLRELLPAYVASDEQWDDDPRARLLPEEAAQIGGAVESRTREFTIARSCARRALVQLGLPEAPILRGSNREPIWPPGVVGSITHCKGFCAAVVGWESDLLSLGIDAETHEELPADLLVHTCLEPEIAWLASAPQGIHWDRVLFSAKESIYKAWFPLTHRWLGFEDVALTFAPAEGTFLARLLVDSPAIDGHALTEFAGRFIVRRGLILTATLVPRQAIPMDSQEGLPALVFASGESS